MQWGQWKDERKGPFSALFFCGDLEKIDPKGLYSMNSNIYLFPLLTTFLSSFD